MAVDDKPSKKLIKAIKKTDHVKTKKSPDVVDSPPKKKDKK